jgi:DNA repair exonuclease SbcCD ATPase subunit
MGLDDALNELDGVEADEFAERLQDERPSLYKQVYSDGFGAGKTEVKSDLESTKDELQSLKDERDDLEQKVQKLEEEQPEAAEIRGKYEEKLQKLQGQIESLQEDKSTLEEEKQSAIRTERERMLRERTKNALISQGVDPDYAEVQVEKQMQNGRVRFDDDLSPKVYEGEDIPSPRNGEDDADEILADSILEQTPDKFVADNRPGSTGLGSTPSGGAGGSNASWDEAESGEVDPEDVLEGKVDIED